MRAAPIDDDVQRNARSSASERRRSIFKHVALNALALDTAQRWRFTCMWEECSEATASGKVRLFDCFALIVMSAPGASESRLPCKRVTELLYIFCRAQINSSFVRAARGEAPY